MAERKTLDHLLTTLDVNLHAFAVCEIARDTRLNFGAMDVVVVHYVLAGSGVLAVKGAEPVAFRPGAILIVPPNVSQSLIAGGRADTDVDAAENCTMLDDGLLRFDAAGGGTGDLRVICGTITAGYGGSFGLFDFLEGPVVDSLTDAPAIVSAFELLIAERAQPDYGSHALCESLMKQCLILLIRRQLRRNTLARGLFAVLKDNRLGAAVGDILMRPGAEHSLADLAKKAGMSRSGFSKAFSESFEETPMDFVLRTRLHEASKLLRISGLPVKSIAASAGFASRSHFSRAFKNGYGVDPSTYRTQQRKVDEQAQSTGWLSRLFTTLQDV